MKRTSLEGLLRELAPQALGALVRRYGQFDLAEDAVQEALLAAAMQWNHSGVPENPRAWLITVASRRLTDLLRSEQARRHREETVARWSLVETVGASPHDDSLILLFMCCHQALSPASQIALTLRAVGGLTTAEIARAFLVPEATMARRITRAKQVVKDSGIPFAIPSGSVSPAPLPSGPAPLARGERLGAVLHVLYLIFNEGYVTTSGPNLQRHELAAEAIRLTRMVHQLLPSESEVTGLLALMLLTDARKAARTGPDGSLIPMEDQDRSLWDAGQIAEGVALISSALPRGATGPYQLQAAIAALHDEAPSAAETDWPQILAIYEVLLRVSDTPLVRLNHAVAVAMVSGPAAGLELVGKLEADGGLAHDHRLEAVRAHLLERSGDLAGAKHAYETAARMATSQPQQRYLNTRAARLLI